MSRRTSVNSSSNNNSITKCKCSNSNRTICSNRAMGSSSRGSRGAMVRWLALERRTQDQVRWPMRISMDMGRALEGWD